MSYDGDAVVDISLYTQGSVRKRIEKLFLENLNRIVTREQIQQVATDPKTGRTPENWHQRLSELRTDYGYKILSHRDDPELKISEYVMPNSKHDVRVNKRLYPTKKCWKEVLQRSGYTCEWSAGGEKCGLHEGDIDPVGGGTVHLEADHLKPHSLAEGVDRNNPDDWQALCGRHQVMKKNYWDSKTGKINAVAIIQAASIAEKRKVYAFLNDYFDKE